MDKGIVKVNMVYLKKGGYVHKGATITRDDVGNFDELVKTKRIELVGDKKEAPKKEVKKAAPKKSE